MRPLLIHKYEKDKSARAQEFYDMFNDQGSEVRRLYTKQKTKVARQTAIDKNSATGSNTGSYLEKAMSKQSKRRASKIVFVQDADAEKDGKDSVARQSVTLGRNNNAPLLSVQDHRDMLKSSNL